MEKEHRYEATVQWTGASAGATRAYESYSRDYTVCFAGKADLLGSADAAFRGSGALHNPEELLVAALSSCHLLTYLALCAVARIPVVSYVDRASGTMIARRGGATGAFSRVVLRPEVSIDSDDLERAQALHVQAHEQCFIANSVNFPVVNEPCVIRAPRQT